MRTVAVAILLVATIPAWASGPKTVVKAEPKQQFDGIHHKNFNGNVVGLQIPAPQPPRPVPFFTSRELITLLCPDAEIANQLFGLGDLPRSGLADRTADCVRSLRRAIEPLFDDGTEQWPPR
jgi:hypothetical protein